MQDRDRVAPVRGALMIARLAVIWLFVLAVVLFSLGVMEAYQ
ncbi:hypothetical protein JDBV13_00190 [Mycobacterium phage june]|nr:hypothetical protein JDBV13_00190 [Mycobacterium phage june]